jgi:SHS2 domain-containing protein
VTDLGRVALEQTVDVDCSAPDDELLLVDWLNSLIYEMATRKLCFGRAQVQIDGHRLRGRASGERLDIGKHEPAVEPKGATYTAARVAREGELWVAQCVVDV